MQGRQSCKNIEQRPVHGACRPPDIRCDDSGDSLHDQTGIKRQMNDVSQAPEHRRLIRRRWWNTLPITEAQTQHHQDKDQHAGSIVDAMQEVIQRIDFKALQRNLVCAGNRATGGILHQDQQRDCPMQDDLCERVFHDSYAGHPNSQTARPMARNFSCRSFFMSRPGCDRSASAPAIVARVASMASSLWR
jgi:hypothetical protein